MNPNLPFVLIQTGEYGTDIITTDAVNVVEIDWITFNGGHWNGCEVEDYQAKINELRLLPRREPMAGAVDAAIESLQKLIEETT